MRGGERSVLLRYVSSPESCQVASNNDEALSLGACSEQVVLSSVCCTRRTPEYFLYVDILPAPAPDADTQPSPISRVLDVCYGTAARRCIRLSPEKYSLQHRFCSATLLLIGEHGSCVSPDGRIYAMKMEGVVGTRLPGRSPPPHHVRFVLPVTQSRQRWECSTIQTLFLPTGITSLVRQRTPRANASLYPRPSCAPAVQTKDPLAQAAQPRGAERRTGSKRDFPRQVHGWHVMTGGDYC